MYAYTPACQHFSAVKFGLGISVLVSRVARYSAIATTPEILAEHAALEQLSHNTTIQHSTDADTMKKDRNCHNPCNDMCRWRL
jgi:hypothetical protein